jgi:uncharacterized protein YkwD
MRGLRKFVALLAALAAVAATAFAAAGPTSAPTFNASMTPSTVALAFEWAIDVERGQRGLGALNIDQVENAQALNWSSLMAFTGTLGEDPNSQAAIASYQPNWRAFGENVGVGATPQSIEAALMASPPHRANILGNYTHVGVGVVIANGRIWVTERFYR